MSPAAAPFPRGPVLVLGVNGQDGSYLAEHLVVRGYPVIGCGRQPQSRYVAQGPAYLYRQLDVSDLEALGALLLELRPAAVFHFAAIHGAAGFDYESVWQDVQRVNTGAVQAVLEHARRSDPSCRLVYASSAKVFGDAMPAVINESSPRLSSCLYSISKNAAHALIDYYRLRHGLQASVIYLFNHESPRRSGEYFVPRLVKILAGALGGETAASQVATLAFYANWGDASEYMDICIDVMERGLGADFVMAHDTTWLGRDMAAALFARYGLEAADFVSERFAAPLTQSQHFLPSNARLAQATGRKPRRSVLEVCDDILRLNYPGIWEQARGRRCV